MRTERAPHSPESQAVSVFLKFSAGFPHHKPVRAPLELAQTPLRRHQGVLQLSSLPACCLCPSSSPPGERPALRLPYMSDTIRNRVEQRRPGLGEQAGSLPPAQAMEAGAGARSSARSEGLSEKGAGASLCGEEKLAPEHQLAEGAALSPWCCCGNSLCSRCAAGAGLASLRGTETCQQAPRQKAPSSASPLPSPGQELDSPSGGKEEEAQHQVLL